MACATIMPRLVFVTDIHLTEGIDSHQRFAGDLAEIDRLEPRPGLLVMGGDICLESPGAAARYDELMATCSLPTLAVMGNHDTTLGEPSTPLGQDFETRYNPVNQHRVLDRDRGGDEERLGWEIHQQDRYRPPLLAVLGWDLAAPMIGIALGMIEEFTARLTGTSGPGRTADSDSVQLRLSQASAELDAARALMRGDLNEIFEKAKSGETFSTLERARFRRDKAFVAQLCLNSVNRLFEISGGHAIFDSGSLQRFHRDIQAAVRRDGFIMELGGLQYGRVALGLDPDGRI